MFDFNIGQITIDNAKIDALVKKKAMAGMLEAAPEGATIAQSIVVVKTGYLRSTIRSEVSDSDRGIIGIIRAAAHYAIYVEKGTSRMAAQPYLLPTLYSYHDRLMAAFLRGAKG